MDEKDVFKVPKQYANEPEKARELERAHYAANVRHKGQIVTRAGKMLEEGTLPDNFKDWDLRIAKGGPDIATEAIFENKLPASFDGWHSKQESGFTFAEYAASVRPAIIPVSVLESPYEDGIFAHHAAQFGKLNEDFTAWERRNSADETVYHMAALGGRLKEGFDKWELESKHGSVAHYAAMKCSLPKNFDRWNLESNGVAVADVLKIALSKIESPCSAGAALGKSLPSSIPDDILHLRIGAERKKGIECSVAHLFAVSNKIPDGYDGWMDRIYGTPVVKTRGVERDNTVYHVAAAHGNLPDSFSKWNLRGHEGNTVAHYAVQSLNPPKGIDNWEDRNNKGKTVLVEHLRFLSDHFLKQVQNGEQAVPQMISKELADKLVAISSPIDDVAHNYARHMPPDFDKWDHKNYGNRTIAHTAADMAALPRHFDKWGMVDDHGDTVAHLAAVSCAKFHKNDDQLVVLPKELEHWHAKNADGETVIEVAKKHGGGRLIEETYASALANGMASSIHGAAPAPELSYKEAAQAMKDGALPADFNGWGKKNSDGWTLAHAAAALGKLPPDFKDWSMEGAKPGITVAHIAMRYSELPASFNDWGLKDASGKTLGEVAVKHPKLGQEYQARIEASKQAQQPKPEVRTPEPQAAKPSSEAQAQGGKSNQAAPIETSSTGRITGGGRFNRPPDLSNREPEPERRPIKAFISRGM